MLGLIALGLHMGARDVLDVWRKVAVMKQNQMQALGLCVIDKYSRWLTKPGYDALNDLLGAIRLRGLCTPSNPVPASPCGTVAP